MMPKIVRVTKTEFELENGTVCPIPIELDEEPNLEEFQEIYDGWCQVFLEKGLLNERKESSQHRQSCRHAGGVH